MVSTKRGVDRRVQRTRQVLLQAFKDVVTEKGFAATSIQDIAERANVNRGTFYHHFTDKYMLIEVAIRDQFQQQVSRTLPVQAGWERENLRLLIQIVLQTFESKYQHRMPLLNGLAPLLERAMYEELAGLISAWLKEAVEGKKRGSVTLETMVSVVSWAIFGSAVEWSQQENALPLEQMTGEILQIITEGIGHMVPLELS